MKEAHPRALNSPRCSETSLVVNGEEVAEARGEADGLLPAVRPPPPWTGSWSLASSETRVGQDGEATAAATAAVRAAGRSFRAMQGVASACTEERGKGGGGGGGPQNGERRRDGRHGKRAASKREGSGALCGVEQDQESRRREKPRRRQEGGSGEGDRGKRRGAPRANGRSSSRVSTAGTLAFYLTR